MAAKGGGESRAGLVVFLVLFILVSIGLGVVTYLAQEKIDAAEKKAAEAEKNKTQWEKNADFYRFVADTSLQYIGEDLPKDEKDAVTALRSKYSDGTGETFTRANSPSKEAYKALIAKLDKNVKSDPAGKPASTYQDEIDRLRKELLTKEEARKKAEDHAADMEALAATRKNELEQAKTDYKTDLKKLKDTSDEEKAGLRTTITTQQAQLDAAGQVGLKGLEPLKADNEKLRTQNKKLTADLQAAVKTITERGYEMDRKQSAEDIDVTKINPANLATVVRITGDGQMPYISLGSADNLKKLVTFSIYGRDIDGRPLKDPKGKLEVVRVVDEHMAQARITELRDERRDPVVRGDFLFNPAWNPNLKQHVAIIGTIDLTGEGRDNTQEFIRALKRENVVVDAWMDMKTLKLRKPDSDAPGEITRQTDMLILGKYPDFGSSAKADDPKTAQKNEALNKLSEVEKEAQKLGVRLVRLNAFLEMSGYALPKPLGSGNGKIEFHRNLPAAGSPVERRDNLKPAEPPAK
jgi:hypothetical protein